MSSPAPLRQVDCPEDLTLYDLPRVPPRHLGRVNWAAGWLEPVEDRFLTVGAQRTAAIATLCRIDDGLSPESMVNAQVVLLRYIDSLEELCKCQLLPKRSHVLVFCWQFLAEARGPPGFSKTYAQTVDMPSAYVAFELLCVFLCVVVLGYHRALVIHEYHPRDKLRVKAAYNDCIQLVARMQDVYIRVVSLSQMTGMLREGLPMQLQPAWLSVFRSYLVYKIVSFAAPEKTFILQSATHHHLSCARAWLVCPDLAPHQVYVAQRAFDVADVLYACQLIRWLLDESRIAATSEPEIGMTLVTAARTALAGLTPENAASMAEVAEQCEQTHRTFELSLTPPASKERVESWLVVERGLEPRFCKIGWHESETI